MKFRIQHLFLILGLPLAHGLLPLSACGQGATFTYQGRVTDRGASFNGAGQLKFALVTSTNLNHQATATASPPSGGYITVYNLIFGGNGYAVAPQVTVAGGGGAGAVAVAGIAGGVVTSVTVSNGNFGNGLYTSAPSVAIAPPPANLTYQSFWSNDGTSSAGSEPATAVGVVVTNGLFTVVLGDTTVANMLAINPTLFTQPNLQLRIWFSDGVNGFAALSPVQNLFPTPYAIFAGTASNVQGTVSAAQISGGVLDNSALPANPTFPGTVAANAYLGDAANNLAVGNSVVANGGSATAIGSFVTASADEATAIGVEGTTASGLFSTAIGFNCNAQSEYDLAIGSDCTASGGSSTAIGSGDTASGNCSCAMGTESTAAHQGSFVWSDLTSANGTTKTFSSSGANQFCIRAAGGVRLDDLVPTSLYFGSITRQMINLWSTGYGIGVQSSTLYQRSSSRFSWFKGGIHSDTQNDPGTGGSVLMTLTSGGLTVNGTLVSSSDRNVKENFKPVDSQAVLEKVAALPLSQWSYKADEEHDRHLGPMAQDFYAAFSIGPDDKHIAVVDESGVALAAIQGLNQKLEARDGEIQALMVQNDLLTHRLNDLAALVKSLAAKE